VTDNIERLKGFLYDKIAQRKKRIHSEHNPRFNHEMQLDNCIIHNLYFLSTDFRVYKHLGLIECAYNEDIYWPVSFVSVLTSHISRHLASGSDT
jgi:hypothetical protein